MKRAFQHLPSDILLLLAATYVFSAVAATALTEANPYTAIVKRNTFALKPALPAPSPVTPSAAPPPNVSLQGISTILGRAQALLKVKIAPKPPEAAKELSLVLDVGQREGDVEVLAIDPAAGTVSLSNQGTPLTLNIKDADKPAAGPAITAPIAQLPSGIPGGLPQPGPKPQIGSGALPTQPLPSALSIPPSASVPTVPTRPLRATSNSSEPVDRDVQAALITVMAEKNKELINSGKTPPPPNIVAPYKQPNQ